MARLVEQGIVHVQRAGPAYLYSLNRSHLAAPAILERAGLKETLFGRLRERLALWPAPPAYAAVFGSAARGDMTPASDIDVFLVRPDGVSDDDDTWRSSVDALARDLTAWTGNDARVLEYAVAEVVDPPGDLLLSSVRADGVTIAGTPDVLVTKRRRVRAGQR